MKKILVNGQWQGGADISTLHGAKEIEDLYLNGVDYDEVDVSDDESDLPVKNNMIGYEILNKQMANVFQHLEAERPDKLFVIGGGCDADFPAIAYMNKKYKGSLKILYFDAHGDINSPKESESKLFYGMPLRCLIKGSDNSLFPIINREVKPEQIIHIGARDLDNAELKFLNENNIHRITAEELVSSKTDITEIFDNCKVYIHLDLDSLEPQEFPYVPLPVPKGIPVETLKKTLEVIKKNSCIVGFGIFEYKPCRQRSEVLNYLIQYGINF